MEKEKKTEPRVLSDVELDHVGGGTNPHPHVNPGGVEAGCNGNNPNCTKTTGKWN
jgi:hypothetical protein